MNISPNILESGQIFWEVAEAAILGKLESSVSSFR